MEFILITAFLLLFFYACRFVGRLFISISEDIEKRDAQKRLFQEQLLTSLKGEPNQDAPQEPNPVEALLRANQELIEKRAVRKAMESELGIKFN